MLRGLCLSSECCGPVCREALWICDTLSACVELCWDDEGADGYPTTLIWAFLTRICWYYGYFTVYCKSCAYAFGSDYIYIYIYKRPLCTRACRTN